ncbi:putative Ig domain-containing protein, partial [Salmonella enterica]|uniref:putative Ig domain-containing protein n=1 Tax=Salmonella enterica TaxID=28901 RepID=UPI00352518D1
TASLATTGARSAVLYTISPIQPGGLLFDSATGSLSGIPTEAVNSAVYTITATDTFGAKGTSKLTLTITRTSLSVPVIGSVTGGPEIGSLVVYFAKPSAAPAGQQYTIQVSDATGS